MQPAAPRSGSTSTGLGSCGGSISTTPLRPRVDATYQSGINAEAAASRLVHVSADAMRREKDLLVVTSELSQADLLSAHLDGALQHQAELLAQAQAQLVQGDAAAGEQRELRVRAEHEASELRMLLDAAAARQRSAQAEVERLSKAMAVQGEELRAVADKLHAHRDSESKAFATRRSIWERTVEEWLTSGFNKRIDPLVYNANKDVFARLQELLGEEQAQREAQSSYLAHASSAELETLRASLGSRIRELEAQNDELMRERFDFGEKLSQSLTAYLKDEIATRDAKIVRLESQLSKTHGTLKELRVAQDEAAASCLPTFRRPSRRCRRRWDPFRKTRRSCIARVRSWQRMTHAA